MQRTIILATILGLLGAGLLAPTETVAAGKKVACTIPTIEALVKEIGGERVEAFSLAAGDQDPHFVSPTPALMKRVRAADLLMEIGMQLELWADEVANGSGNPRIFRGAPGRIVLAAGIPKLEVPSIITRAEGDIHPEGNPHLWLDPVRAKLLAANIARALRAASPEDASTFDSRLKAFEEKVDRALFGDRLLEIVGATKLSRLALDGRLHEFLESNEFDGRKLVEYEGGWVAKARPLRGQKVIEFHKVWVYLANTFGFRLVGTIEEKPGSAPGPQHVSRTIEVGKRDGVRLILVDNFYDASLPERVAREIGGRVIILPNQVRGEREVHDFFSLIEHVLDAMLKATPPPREGSR